MKKFILIVVSSLLSFTITAQCHIDDFNALKAIYDSLDGNNWVTNTGWDLVRDNATPPMGCDLSTLFGVGLNQSGRVDSLSTANPQGNDWDGRIPEAIGDLEFLRVLHLRRNRDIDLPLPAGLFDLNHLEFLNIASNDFTGNIPSDLFDLTSLKHLDISANDFTGPLSSDIQNLVNLEYFHFSDLPLTGNIPDEIGNLTSLKILLFGDNNFSGGLPTTIGNLSNLEELQIVSFATSTPSGSIPSTIGNLSNLKKLHFANLLFTGGIPTQIGNLTNLEELNFDDLDLTGQIPASLSNLTKLRKFFITTLRDIVGPIPDLFGNMTDLNEIRVVSNTDLNGPFPHSVFSAANLEVLAFGQNDITDTLSSLIGSLPRLKTIRLEGNNFTGDLPGEFVNLDSLVEMNISHNAFTGQFPNNFFNLTDLEIFEANFCNLTGPIPDQIGNLTKLRVFDVSNNNLCGSLPSGLSNLNFLSSLGVFGDQLGGCFDPTLQSLCGQIFFYAQNGQFDASWIDFCNSSSGACSATSNTPFLTNSLTHFYNDMKGQDWIDDTDWLSNEDPCGLLAANDPWFGVLCNGSGDLIHLTLPNNNVDSVLSKSIGRFCELTEIDLSGNEIDDLTIELGSLSKLRVLDLESNNIDNAIFLSPRPLPASLTNLNMADNNLSFIPDQLEFLSLNRLDLSQNMIFSEIPTFFTTFDDLILLDLSDNLLHGTIPSELGDLDVVPPSSFIDLSNNNLKGCIPANFSNLCNVVVNLNGNSNLENESFVTFCSQQEGSCPGCAEHLNLTGNITSGTYEASSSITCSGIIAAGANVIFSAPDSVVMTNNFTVENTAVYEVDDTGCN